MGKDLHPSIMPFVKKRMENHQNVLKIVDISTNEYYMFNLIRSYGLRDVVVLISDCYHFSEFDYHSKPVELNNGGFILIAKPESSFTSELQNDFKQDKIIIGRIGILLGALRIDRFWTYEKPSDENVK